MSTITYTSAHPLLHRRRNHFSTHLFFPQTLNPTSKHKSRFPLVVRASLSDPFVLDIAEKLEDSLQLSSTNSSSVASSSISLQRLRESSTQSILTKAWPSSKQELFRFTDTSFLRRSQILPSTTLPSVNLSDFVTPPPISSNSIVIVDGHFAPTLSDISSLPNSVYAGVISDIPAGSVSDRVSSFLASESVGKDLFWDLNGVGAPDVVVIYVPEGVRIVDDPISLRFWACQGVEAGEETLPVSNPRVLVVVEKGAEVAIVEEHVGVGGNEERCYWENSVVEIVVGDSAKVSHSYVQRQSRNAAHIKWTFARQESFSTYELVEISTGGKLSRHNLHVEQMGPDTVTNLSAFHISQTNQTQDLHSKLTLDHPRAHSQQIHKCIVANSSGQAVFDGNIKVNRYAQQTDAGQLTRTLLLAPRATANVKPNLQIIADDVKCSHGATISDLEDDQLFYFLARGIDLETARDALVFSFGSEVVSKLQYEPLQKETANYLKSILATQKLSQSIMPK